MELRLALGLRNWFNRPIRTSRDSKTIQQEIDFDVSV